MTFNEFYTNWFFRMKCFAREYVISENDAEDIVQDIFMELLGKYDSLSGQNITAYAFAMIKNRCIDHLRRKIMEQQSAGRIREEHTLELRMKFDSLEVLDDGLFKENMEETIDRALDTLPARCKEIFIMHKYDGLKQKQIAETLGLSRKTVENQLTIAYKKLREELKNLIR